MKYEAVIGIEIHVELKTQSKMFSSAPNCFGAEANTLVSALDMAFPGTLPTLNKQAVIHAIRVCHALHMEIDRELWFDRKNYFYADLPKGYQITQDKRPIGKEGYVRIPTDQGEKIISIERLHMEEDTCKQLHLTHFSLIDYNRAGTPLIEIVSRPDMHSGQEAMNYVEAIRSIVVYSEVSDGKMEEGSLRCDVNISLREVGTTALGTKVEIKNLNSIANVQKAIDFEIIRQTALLENGESVEQETRRYDETKKETVLMRKKTNAVDYKYYTEANLCPTVLSEGFIEEAIRSCPELAEAKQTRYISNGLSKEEAMQMVTSKEMSFYFDQCLALSNNQAKAIWNFLTVDIASYLKKKSITFHDFHVDPKHILAILSLIEKKEISYAQGRQVFEQVCETGKAPQELVDELGLKQNSNEAEIIVICRETLDENPQSVEDYKNGKDRALGFLVGQVMKKTKGKVNPQITSATLVDLLKER